MSPHPLYWRVSCAAVLVLSVLTFTPAVIPEGVTEPALLGVPRTLWAGILLTVALVAMTYIGARVHPGHPDTERERKAADVMEGADE